MTLTLTETAVLLRPLWLLGLLPLLALGLLLWRGPRGGDWAALVDPALWAEMRRIGQVTVAGRDRGWMVPLALGAALVLGLSGPAVLRPRAVEYRALDPMILMLDLSPSITGGPGLGDLQAAAAFMLANAGGRPVGLVAYAADAYLASAPTSDAESLQSLIAVLGPDTMPVRGSRPDIALSSLRDMLGAEGVAGADVVVISDGGAADGPAIAEARRLNAEGARIWGLAVERNADGAPPPDRGALGRLAAAGGGAEAAARDPRPLLSRIAAARTARLALSDEAGRHFRDLGPWILLLALPPALLLCRRRL